MRKKITALFLAVVMAVTLLPTAFAAGNGYSDTQGHWGEDAIDRWSGYGVISGTGNGLFDPSAPLTRAQAAQIFANLLNLSATASVAQYTDVAVGSWYYDAIAKCVAAGILNGTGSNTMSPNTYVSREELFVMFARALGIQPQASAGVTFTDSASTASWAAGYVNALADMGVVGGSGDGTLAPKADIDRASVVALLDKAITAYGNTSGATVGSSSGIVLVVADNVTVMGSVETLVVAGGSAGISGSTVGSISVVGESASVSVGGSANVGQVSVTGANASVTVRGEATVSGVTIADTAQGAELTVSGDATVTAVDSAAQNVTISGDGTIEAATVSGDNTTVDTDGTDLTVSEGTTGVTENDKNVSAGDTVVTKPAEDTGSSGESTTPSRPTNPSRPSYDYYTVTFMLDENTVYDTQRVREGRTVEQPVAPTKDGYRFDGWYLDGAVVAYDFTAPVENDITLTARWLANPVTVTLVEGQNIYTYQTEYGTTLNEATLNAVIEVERPYETVTGWWIDIGYNTKYDFTTVVTGDMTLYYGCTWKEYTLTFMVDGSPVSTQPVDYSVSLNNYFPACTEEGFSWTWYTDEAFTQPVASDATMPGNDLTLYGQWTHNASGLKGHGTESDPFLISNADEMYAAGQLQDSQNHFELLNDIDMNEVSNTVSDVYGDEGDIGYIYGELDGANHTIKGKNSTDGTILYAVNAVIKNVTFADLTHTAVRNATNTTFENVTVNGSMEVGNNTGAFVVYAVPSNGEVTLTFDNCIADVEMEGPGVENAYNAVFVGYAYGQGNKTTLNFTNCVNNGDLTCGKAAMFLGNDCGTGVVTINISNCTNNGNIRSTFVKTGYISNPFVAVGAHSQNTIVLNGRTLNLGTAGYDGNVAVGGNGGFYQGPDDTTLALVKNSDGTFTITAATAGNVSSYKVTMSLYAKLVMPNGELEGGTNVVGISETVEASAFEDGKVTTTLKHLAFVDEDWVNNHSDLQPTTEGENTVYTSENTSYYYIGSEADTSATLLGNPTMPTMISVSAYDAEGNLLCSANLSSN